jgi:4-hydroxybenzoate polyprenyltransferase
MNLETRRRFKRGWRRAQKHPFLTEALPLFSARLVQYGRLMRIDRPIGTWLVLWPTLWALWLAADGHPDPGIFAIFIAGTFLMRSAGCIINDFVDRGFDPHVERTRERPLATGRVGSTEALCLFAVLALAAFVLVLQLNRLTIWLSFVGIALAMSYPFMKRFTYLPQPYLGLAFVWGIPMAFAAEAHSVPPVAWLLFIANILWSTVYDTMYAMVDKPYDLKIGVKSTAILFGDLDRPIVGLLQVTMLVCLYLVGLRERLGPAYDWSLLAAAAFAIYEQVLIRRREPAQCFQAFLNNNWFGAAVFVGIALSYIFNSG